MAPFNRAALRYRLMVERPICEWPGCEDMATDMHELIPRNRTELNSEARDLSFSPEIVSMLCQKHHAEQAHANAQTARNTLLAVNVARYGREAVAGALEAVRAVLDYHLDIYLGDEK